MTTILAAEINIERQEGDTAGIVIELPEIINLPGKNIHLEVFDKSLRSVFAKTSWAVDGQTVSCDITEADTKGKAGRHRYEFQVWDAQKVYTTLRGEFLVHPERIKAVRHE